MYAVRHRPLRKAGAPALGTYSHPNLVIDKYVATGGSDAAAGDVGTPWATIGKAFTDVNFPNNGWLAVRGGTYNNQNNGSVSGKVVNIVAYPGEPPTFDGTDTQARLIAFGNGTAGTTVRGIQVQNYKPTITERAAIAFNEGGTIEHCYLFGNLIDPDDGFTCLRFSLSATNQSMMIRHCTVVGSAREGIGGGGNAGIFGSLTVQYNDIHGCCLNDLLADFDITAAAIKYTGLQHADILDNHIWDCDGRGVWADVQCLDGRISGNWIHDIRGFSPNFNQGDGIFYEISGDGVIINNWLHDNTRAGVQVSSGHRVYVMHNASFRNRAAFWLRDANRTTFVNAPPAERYQHPSDVHFLNNLFGDFIPGGSAAGNAFFRYENANGSSHDLGAVVGGADPYGPIAISNNHYWQPVAGTPAHVSRLDLAAGGDNNNTTWANHQADGFDANGSISSAVGANPFLRHEPIGDLRLPPGHPLELTASVLPEVVAARIGKITKAYSPGPLEPLSIY